MHPQSDTNLQKSEHGSDVPQFFTWEEIGLCSGQGYSKEEKWLVIHGKVYDISQFHLRHPGGSRVISTYAGQDATDAFTAFHKNETLVQKYLSSLQIGQLAPDQPSCEPHKNEMLVKDFRELHSRVKKMGLLKPSYGFFLFMFMHAFLLDAAAWATIWYFGKSWMPFLISAAMVTIAQIQYGFLLHDLGHGSAFHSTKWNRLFYVFVIAILKGLPPCLWSELHNLHHAKTNCFRKDPGIDIHPFLFTLGKTLSVKLGEKKKKYMPYQYQHIYFAFIAPLGLLIIVHVVTVLFTIMRKKWLELAFVLIYVIRVYFMYVPLMGFQSFMAFYWLTRFLETTWFLWLLTLNHIPMNIDYDKNLDWVTIQVESTCNVDQSLFNDWSTGHLTFHIEHHLFPTMPRHNFQKVAPLVKSLCAKHGIQYQCKPLLTAFVDLLRSLKESGQHWQEAYSISMDKKLK